MIERIETIIERLIVLVLFLYPVFFYFLELRNWSPPIIDAHEKLSILTLPRPKEIVPKSREIHMEEIEGKLAMDPLPVFEKQSFGFGWRNEGARMLLAAHRGGGEDTEAAVEAGLEYLVRIQESDGSWSQRKNPVGSTALALLAFFGSGYHHKDGKHQNTMNRGVEYLLRHVGVSDGAMQNSEFYWNGVAAMAFAEAYALSGDLLCRDAASKITGFIVSSQGPEGGWGQMPYAPHMREKYRYSTFVSGWMALALSSARTAKISIDGDAINKYLRYVRFITNEKGLAASWWEAGKKEDFSEAMAASVVSSRFSCGEDLDAESMKESLACFTTRIPPSLRPKWLKEAPKDNKDRLDNEFWHHAALSAYYAGGKSWEMWNKMLKDLLVKNQIKEGFFKGAWDETLFKGGDRSEIYGTCLNILTLETYYRYWR